MVPFPSPLPPHLLAVSREELWTIGLPFEFLVMSKEFECFLIFLLSASFSMFSLWQWVAILPCPPVRLQGASGLVTQKDKYDFTRWSLFFLDPVLQYVIVLLRWNQAEFFLLILHYQVAFVQCANSTVLWSSPMPYFLQWEKSNPDLGLRSNSQSSSLIFVFMVSVQKCSVLIMQGRGTDIFSMNIPQLPVVSDWETHKLMRD